jgi:hypothetical protein
VCGDSRIGAQTRRRRSGHPSRVDHALAPEDAGDDSDRWLLIGPDTAGNLLEVVIMITAEGTQLVIHAMPMRDQYRRLLGL